MSGLFQWEVGAVMGVGVGRSHVKVKVNLHCIECREM